MGYNGLGQIVRIGKNDVSGYFANGGVYNNVGNLISISAGNGTGRSQSWEALTNHLISYDWNVGKKAVALGWDNRGNIISESGEHNVSYKYDTLNHLTTETTDVPFELAGNKKFDIGYCVDDVYGGNAIKTGNQAVKFDYYASSIGFNLNGTKKVNALELKGKSERIDGKYLEVYVSATGNDDDWREVRDVTAVRTSDGVKLLFKESVDAKYVKIHSTWDERDVYNKPVDKAEVYGELADIAEVFYIADGKSNSYSYDAKGNRIGCVEGAKGTEGVALAIEYYEGCDLLKSYDGWYFNYDNNGNLIARGNAVESEASGDGAGVSAFTFSVDKGELWQYEYDLSNRMVKVLYSECGSEGLGERAGYKYDYRGLCVYKTNERGVEYREYTADGRLIYVEKDGSVTDYVYNGSTIFAEVRVEGGKEEVYYHHTNHLGTTEVISDAKGEIVWEASYEAFGSVLSENGTKAFAASFTGKLYDEDIGLYYFNARWYDSESGRFVTQDPARDGIDWYVYCKGNPVTYIDPDGYTITIASGTSEEDADTILNTLQLLTTHELKNDNGNIVISKYADDQSSTPNGDILIKRLIEETMYNCEIAMGKAGSGNSESDIDSENATNGKGSGSKVNFDKTANPSILTTNPETGFVEDKGRPNEIGLGHELIHADRSMRGVAIPYNQKGNFTYKTKDGNVTECKPLEEYATVGLQEAKEGDITENDLRSEHNLNLRGAY